MQRVLFTAALGVLIATALSAETRKWTSKDGRYTTEAELIDRDDTGVTLKKPSGDTVTVPLDRLSDADRRYVQQWKKAGTSKQDKDGKQAKADGKGAKTDGKDAKTDGAGKETVVSYVNDVQPFLAQYCAECHRKGHTSSGYDVSSYTGLTREGKYGALVIPGKPDTSRLYEAMDGMSKSMPPAGSTQPTTEEIAKIAAWIKAGAKDDSPPAAAGKAPKKGSRRTP